MLTGFQPVCQVNGFVTGYGSPAWRASHQPAQGTAPAVKVASWHAYATMPLCLMHYKLRVESSQAAGWRQPVIILPRMHAQCG